jgi:hypothetical protein
MGADSVFQKPMGNDHIEARGFAEVGDLDFFDRSIMKFNLRFEVVL